MRGAVVGRSVSSSLRSRWRSLGPRQRGALIFVSVSLLAALAWEGYRAWTGWPARAVLRTPGDTWPLGFSPDSRMFVTSSLTRLTLWDVETGRARAGRDLPGGRAAVAGAFSPDGRTLALALTDRDWTLYLTLVDPSDGRVKTETPTSQTSIYHLHFSGDGRRVRAFLGDATALKQVVRLDAETGTELSNRLLTCPTQGGTFAFAPDGRLVALCRRGVSTVTLWDIEADRALTSLTNPCSIEAVSGLGFTPDGGTLAIGRDGGSIELWDVAARRLTRTLRGHTGGSHSVGIRFSADGRILASDGVRSPVPGPSIGAVFRSLWSQVTGRTSGGPPSPEVLVLDTARGTRLGRVGSTLHPFCSPDGRTLATREIDFSVRLRDIPRPSR